MDRQRLLLETYVEVARNDIRIFEYDKARITRDIDAIYNQLEVLKQNYHTELLFCKARLFAVMHGYRYVWYNGNRIFIKKDDFSSIFTLQDEIDLLVIYNVEVLGMGNGN